MPEGVDWSGCWLAKWVCRLVVRLLAEGRRGGLGLLRWLAERVTRGRGLCGCKSATSAGRSSKGIRFCSERWWLPKSRLPKCWLRWLRWRAKWVRLRPQGGGLTKRARRLRGPTKSCRPSQCCRLPESRRCWLCRLPKGGRRGRSAKGIGFLAQRRGLPEGTAGGRRGRWCTEWICRRGCVLERNCAASKRTTSRCPWRRPSGGPLANVDPVRVGLSSIDYELYRRRDVIEGVLNLLLGILVQGLNVVELSESAAARKAAFHGTYRALGVARHRPQHKV